MKSALSLCHSNADVERSLSVNKRVLTKERTGLKTETLIGIRHTKSAIARYGDVTKVPVTRDLLQAAQRAWGVYAAKLREEKEEKKLKEKQAAAKEEKKAKKRQAEERYNDVMKELAGLNEEADKLQEHLDRTMQSIWEETAKITGAKGDAIQIAAAVHQLEFWKKQQTELSTKIAEIGQKRKQKDEEKDALAKKSKL